MSLGDEIEIERRGVDAYRLRWPQGAGIEAVRASSAVDAIDALAATVTIGESGADIQGLAPAARHYFHLSRKDLPDLVVAHRHVPLIGARNFRDFGGYRTEDGRRVRWGRLYRSGHLGAMTAADQAQVAALGIGLICDFRRDSERDTDPNRLGLEHRPQIENLPIAPGNTANVFTQVGTDGGAATVDAVAQYMIDINRDLALLQRPAYRRMFEALLERDAPLLVHCAVGKDRTGFAAALILGALGVSEATILEDYLLTSRYLPAQEEVTRLLEKYPSPLNATLFLPLLEARAVYLQAALDAVRSRYGDLQVYLHEYLGIEPAAIEQLRGRLLQA